MKYIYIYIYHIMQTERYRLSWLKLKYISLNMQIRAQFQKSLDNDVLVS